MSKRNLIFLRQEKETASFVKDFRPISLTFSIYKIEAKVIAERLKEVISSIISHYQSVFLEGIQILDPIL